MKSVNILFSDGAKTLNCEGFISGNFIVLISKDELLTCVYDMENNEVKWVDLEGDNLCGRFKKASDLERMNFGKVYHYIVSHMDK
jgi:hypothetical protein